jgi:hypothetical protein
MLYRDATAIYTEIHTEHINTLCGHNTEILIVGHYGAYITAKVCVYKHGLKIRVYCHSERMNNKKY